MTKWLALLSFILGKKNIEVDLNTQFNLGRGKSILRRRESNMTIVKPEKHELETRLGAIFILRKGFLRLFWTTLPLK